MCILLPGVGLQCVKQVPGNQILLEWRAPSLRITERRDPVRTLRVWAASPRRPAAPISRRRAVRAAGPRGRRCATSGRMSQLSVGVCMEAEFRAQGDGEPGMELLCGVTTCDVTMTWGESRWDFYSDVKFRLDAARHASIGAACSAAAVDYSCFFKNPHFCSSSCFFCSFFHFTHDSNNRRHSPVDFFLHLELASFFFFQLIYFLILIPWSVCAVRGGADITRQVFCGFLREHNASCSVHLWTKQIKNLQDAFCFSHISCLIFL